MYEWLEEEISSVNTGKFYLVDGPASAEFSEMVAASDFPLPASYKQFVLQFGNVKLYRRSSYWLVEVYAGPREAETDESEPLILFGRTHTSLVYFKESLLVAGGESPIFEWQKGQGIRQVADSFPDWLKAKCAWARKQYKKKEWQAIEQGPAPFTQQELAVVEAREQFRWQVIGIAPNEDLRFEIHNGSTMVLPYLSVGIRGQLRPPETGPLHGGGYLPISTIQPGETGSVDYDCYKQFVDPKDVEVFELPSPGPEDREQYWEFKELS